MAYTYAVVAIAAFICAFIIHKYTGRRVHLSNGAREKVIEEDASKMYEEIEPLTQLDWQSTPPMKLRLFKPKYHLTMGK